VIVLQGGLIRKSELRGKTNHSNAHDSVVLLQGGLIRKSELRGKTNNSNAHDSVVFLQGGLIRKSELSGVLFIIREAKVLLLLLVLLSRSTL